MRPLKQNLKIAALLRKRVKVLQIEKARFAQLTGFQPFRISGLLDGSTGLRLEWVEAVAEALQIDRGSLVLLTVEQVNGDAAAHTIRQLMAPPLADAERAWLGLIRQASDEVVAFPSDLERRVVSALLVSDNDQRA